MIAYNHLIQFIPELKKSKNTSSSFKNIIKIKENNSLDFSKNMKFQMTFTNNQGRDIALYTEKEFERTSPKQQWIFDVEGVVTFFWFSGELTIDYSKKDNFTPGLLNYWTLHILLPIFLTIEEHCYFLHAGAIEINNDPILFVAESFGGKSTMTDFFIKQGHPMVSDDKVAIIKEDGKFLAVPSHPHHRPYRNMEDLGYFVKNMSNTPKPIRAIYTLHRVAPDAQVSISELLGLEKFKSLRFSSEINLSFLQQERFKNLGDLAKNVPIFKVNVPWNIERIGEVYTAITEHCNSL